MAPRQRGGTQKWRKAIAATWNTPNLGEGKAAPMPTAKPNSDKSNKSDKPKRPPRRKNRFNEREVARAGRAGKAIGAERIEVDPATGKISIIITKPGGAQSDNEVEVWL